MGNILCGGEQIQMEPNIFQYRYGEDNKELKIQHNDRLISDLDEIMPSLNDCENQLRHSTKRFKDLHIGSQPLKLICQGRQIRCHFERPQSFLKKDQNSNSKIYKIVDKLNCVSSYIAVGDEVMQYFGVFLCYLADNPQLIEQIILTKQNSYGVAALHVVHQGKREVLFIDDYILCNELGPLFCKPVRGSDMWPCLLEKAWFKLKRFLKNKIDKVHPTQVFHSFLMFPLKTYVLGESKSQNWSIIKQKLLDPQLKGQKISYVVTSKQKPEHKMGLSGRRNFYLLRVFDFQGAVYFYLRNPCGHFDFRGQLCDIPQKIANHIQKLTGEYPVPTPGNFLLTQQEFEQQIQSFFTAVYSKDSPIISEKQVNLSTSETQEAYVKFEIKKSCPVSLNLRQASKFGIDPLTYLLVDTGRTSIISGLHNDEGCFGQEETNLLNLSYQILMPGTYILRLKKKPAKRSQNYQWLAEATLNSRDILIASAQESIKLQISPTNQYKDEFFEVIKQYAKKELAQNKRSAKRDEVEHVVLWLGDIVVIYLHKLNTGKEEINVEVNFPDLQNLTCLSHNIGKGYGSLTPFKQDTLVVFEKVSLTEKTSLGSYGIEPF